MREYIENKDPEFLNFFEKLYDIWPLDDSEPWYTESAQIRWNKSVDNNLWSLFEKNMGNPNTTEMLELSTSVTEDMPSIGVRDTMDYYWKDHFGGIEKLSIYVKEWVETIDTDSVKPRSLSLINSEDLFLTFNYTDLLEKIYNIDNVLHIHGGVDSVSNISPIMGHCNIDDIKKHKEWSEEAENEFAEAEASIQSAVAIYLESIYKDTNRQIRLHREFFNRLDVIKNVVIIGWSGGEVDVPYINEIIANTDTDTLWTIYWHTDDDYMSLTNLFNKLDNIEKRQVSFEHSNKFWDN